MSVKRTAQDLMGLKAPLSLRSCAGRKGCARQMRGMEHGRPSAQLHRYYRDSAGFLKPSAHTSSVHLVNTMQEAQTLRSLSHPKFHPKSFFATHHTESFPDPYIHHPKSHSNPAPDPPARHTPWLTLWQAWQAVCWCGQRLAADLSQLLSACCRCRLCCWVDEQAGLWHCRSWNQLVDRKSVV